MANALGIKGIMGVAKQTAFRTALDATDRVPLLSEGIDFEYTDALHEYLHGSAGIPGMERLFEPVLGSVDMLVPYTVKNTTFVSASLPLALGMGTCTWDAGQGSNRITFLDQLNVFGTFAWNKWKTAGDVMEAIGVFIKSFTLTATVDQPLKLTCEVIAYDLKRQAGTTVNQYSELTALATDVPDLVLFRHFIFRVGNQAGVMADADRHGIESFTLTVDNNLTDPEQSTIDNTSSHTDPMHMIQPERNGFRTVTLEVVLPRYGDDTFFDHITSEDDLQGDLLATHPSSSEEFDIIFPYLKLDDVKAPVEGPNALKQTLSFKALERNSNSDMTFSDGSTTDVGEVWFETDDDRTADILA